MWELVGRMTLFLDQVKQRSQPRFRTRSRARPGLEWLETRQMLTASGGVGTDYTLMGGQWNNNRAITFSIPPDGVSWGSGTDNLNAKLDAEFGGTSWVGLISDALQVWASATNLNFELVPDGNYAFNVSGLSEGDPRFGDIRIGGYDLGTSSVIAQTYGPPPNGSTASGDVQLNTSMNFAPGSGYDFESVMIHEIGHALGLGESPQPSSVMYRYYSGVHHSLSDYDIEGMDSLYGARTADSYQSQNQATAPSTALDLTSSLNSSHQTQVGGLSLSTIGDTEYFSVVAPAINGSTLSVGAQPGGYSQLNPKVTVIDPTTGATLGTASNPSVNGTLALTSIPGVIAGHRYLIEVTGATSDNFAIGSYAIQVGFNGGTPVNSSPTPAPTPAPTPVSPTPTPTPTPTPVASEPAAPVIQADAYAYNSSFANATNLGTLGLTTASNLTLPSGQNYQLFSFVVQQAGTVMVAAGNVNVVVGDSLARPVVQGTGLLIFVAPTAGAKYYLLFLSANATPVANYGFAVKVVPAPTPTPASTPVVSTTASRLAAIAAAAKASGNKKVKIAAVTPKVTNKVASRPNQ